MGAEEEDRGRSFETMAGIVAVYGGHSPAAVFAAGCIVAVRRFFGQCPGTALHPGRRSAGDTSAGFTGFGRRLGNRGSAGGTRIIIRQLGSRWPRAGLRSLPDPRPGSPPGAAASPG